MYVFLLFFIAMLLIAVKASFIGLRLSDSNIYFYTAWLMLHGHTLYKDIFFTNLPLFPYISSIYVFILRDISLYYFTSCIEVIITSFLIFFSLRKSQKDDLIALIGGILYITSFTVLATSDHQSGVFLASLFAMAAYLSYQYKKYILVGIFLACCVLTKAYFIPIPAAFFIYALIKERKTFFYTLLGFSLTVFIILLPSLIYARQQLFNDVVLYSLQRSQGLSKLNIFWFFIKQDIVLDVLLISTLIRFRQHVLLSLITCFSILLVLIYQDIYFLYLNILVPFLILSIGDWVHIIKNVSWKYASITILIIVSLLQLYNLYSYLSHYAHVSTITDTNELIETIQKNKPAYLYGENDLTPALAYLTNVPLLNTQIDTNENIFRKGLLNKETLTKKAIEQRTIIVTYGIDYPGQNMKDPLVSAIMNKEQIEKNCKLILSQPVVAEGIINRVTLFRCY